MASKDQKVLAFLMLSQIGGGSISLSAHPWALDETLTAFSSASLEDLQPSRCYCRQVKMNTLLAGLTKDILTPHGTEGLECLPLQTALVSRW